MRQTLKTLWNMTTNFSKRITNESEYLKPELISSKLLYLILTTLQINA